MLTVTWEVRNDTKKLDKFSQSDLQQGRDLCVSISCLKIFLTGPRKNSLFVGGGVVNQQCVGFLLIFHSTGNENIGE